MEACGGMMFFQATARMSSFQNAPRFIVHSMEDVRLVLEAAKEHACPVVLRNSTETLRALGPAWFVQLARLAGDEFPDVKFRMLFASGDAPGFALAALRLGITTLEIPAESPTRDAVISAAQQMGCIVMDHEEALDLLMCDTPSEACRRKIADAARD